MEKSEISPHLWHKALLFAKDKPRISINDLKVGLTLSESHARKLMAELCKRLPDRIVVAEQFKLGRPRNILQQFGNLNPNHFAKLLAEAESACISPQYQKEQAFLADKQIVNTREIMDYFHVSTPAALKYLRRFVAQYPDEWRLIPISFGRGRPMLGIARIPRTSA